jgi:Flp pilus assembly protein TadG
MTSRPQMNPTPEMRRRGAISVWLLVAIPALLLMLIAVTDLGNVWLARIELEHSLETAALAAAETWAKSPDPTLLSAKEGARQAGVDFAAANNVRGKPVVLDLNNAPLVPLTNPNGNASCSGDILLGNISGTTFDANATLTPAFGVRTKKTVVVQSLWKSGMTYHVSAETFAVFDTLGLTLSVQLVRITTVTCT